MSKKKANRVYRISHIMGHKLDATTGETHYLIRWLKYSSRHDSWEPERALGNATAALDEYWRDRLLSVRREGKGAWEVLVKASRIGVYPTAEAAARAHDRAAMYISGWEGRHEWMFPQDRPCIPTTEEIRAIESWSCEQDAAAALLMFRECLIEE